MNMWGRSFPITLLASLVLGGPVSALAWVNPSVCSSSPCSYSALTQQCKAPWQ